MVKTKTKSAKISKVPKETAKPEFDITKHILVPEHRIISKIEVEKLLKVYNISLHQLPLIKEKDPVVQAIGGKTGDVIRIIRDGPTKTSHFFRRVIE